MTSRTVFVSISDAQLNLLEQSYAELKQSVYEGLVLQTRLKPYLDEVNLTIDESGIEVNFSVLEGDLNAQYVIDRHNAIIDRLEIVHYAGAGLISLGWDGIAALDQWIAQAEADGQWAAIRAEAGAEFFEVTTDRSDLCLGTSVGDRLNGQGGNDTVFGAGGNDDIRGNAGNDILDGGAGDDYLEGNAGSDTYVFSRGGGHDSVAINEALGTRTETLRLAGINLNEVTLSKGWYDNHLTITVNNTGDSIRLNDFFYDGSRQIDILEFGDGTVWDRTTLLAQEITVTGTAGNDGPIVGRDGGPDAMYGLAGSDTMRGGNNTDRMFGGDGNDDIRGNAGNDILDGGAGDDYLEGNAGSDILQGCDGNDNIVDGTGTALFNGGAGADSLTGGSAAEVYLGGTGNDTLGAGAGNDVILFNKGDGQDTFAAGGTGSDTLSLGGGIAYGDLVFTKSANDLVLKIGASDQITFKDWYAGTPSKPVTKLQVMAEAMAGFVQGGSDPLLNQKVENFNFTGLASAFDAARAANSGLTSWALSNALASNNLGGSDSAAIGGDLAYQYGRNGTLTGIGVTPALAVLADANLGTGAQTLSSLASLQTGLVRLT